MKNSFGYIIEWMRRAVVLGAGIQGVCCAFALEKNGYEVILIDKEGEVFSKTSKTNEGRIHLGFMYCNDKSLETGSLMLRSSLTFASCLEEWVGKINWKKYLLEKGHYLIHKESCLASEDEIISYYEKLNDIYLGYIENDQSASYFGQRPERLFRVLNKVPDGISNSKVSRVVETEERCIELFYFRELILRSLLKSKIRVLTETEVKLVERNKQGFTVLVVNKDGDEHKVNGEIVVNCLWNNRITIDETMGINAPKDYMYRLKIGILGKTTRPVPNCSIVSGPYGNIDPRLEDFTYISWHPDCMREITTNVRTPESWEKIFIDPDSKGLLESDWVQSSIDSLSEFVPAIESFKPYKFLPGIICSAGNTDIHDIKSKVHNRAANMGVFAHDGYFSIDTGKFASAPLHAKKLIKELSIEGKG